MIADFIFIPNTDCLAKRQLSINVSQSFLQTVDNLIILTEIRISMIVVSVHLTDITIQH